jgi:hypothetical protein
VGFDADFMVVPMVGSFSPMEVWSHRKTTSTAAAAVDGDGIPNWFRGFVADLKGIPTVVLVFSGGPRFGRNLRNKQRLGFFFFLKTEEREGA